MRAVPPNWVPIRSVMEGGGALRCRLDVPTDQIPWGMLRMYAEGAATEYYILPLDYSDGRHSFFWCITDQAGGFRDEQIAQINQLAPTLSLRMELASAYAATDSLLETYLGANAAKRVLAGAFKRGTGETVHAVIFYCDMRGFTSLVDSRPVAEVIPLLNSYFEAVAGQVEKRGGEILKFIGDAMLAVFAIGDADASDQCFRALQAAEEAIAALDGLNRAQLAATPLQLGVALHRGEVMYGNIGAETRLDFTVIGAAVNEAVRVESMCKQLGVPLLMTAAFRASTHTQLASLGEHTLRGVSAPIEVFTLPALAPAAAVAGK